MMSADQRSKFGGQRPGIDFTEIDAKETSRAWNRFLTNRNAPSMPLTGVRSIIYDSWVRSDAGGVRPEQYAAPSLEPSVALSKASHDNVRLRRATQASLTHIGELLSGAEAMLILTDRDGVILVTVGDPSTLNKAYKINLSVSGVWNEGSSGTNGIGTALATGKPVYVHGEEHFCEGMKAWSCAGAPIRDPIDGSIIGVINLSGLTTIFQKHNAAFAATAARDIEVALRQEQWSQNMCLMEAIIEKYPVRVQDPTDGLAIVDRFGRLIFNRNTGLGIAQSTRDLGLGARFLELPDGISEEAILASLPAEHRCHDIRLIDIDGEVRGAALAFKVSAPPPARNHRAVSGDLPGVTVGSSHLKIIGRSDAIVEAIDVASRIASAGTPILIEGETGVGKELFARLIYSQNDPGDLRPFTAINCGAMTLETLDETLLKPMQVVGVGPMCLDEIGELPPAIQPYLLRVLEEQMTRLYGPDQSEPAMRLVSLTNRILLDEVEAGRFRRDLFYRISSINLKIPPLRDRGDDILLIAEYYNRKGSVETGRDLLVLNVDVQEALMTHTWPGNVRELRNTIASLHFLAKSRHVTLDDLPHEVTQRADLAQPETSPMPMQHPANTASLRHAEEVLIQQALVQNRGNLSQTARSLGISRPTLYRKMNAFGITLSPAKGSYALKTP